MVTTRHIRKLARSIADRFDPERIILFGSRAYGTPSAESVVDLLIIMPFAGSELNAAVEILSSTQPNFPVDLVIHRPADAARRYREHDPLLREAIDNGKVLYERNRPRMGGKSRRGLHLRHNAASAA